MGANKLKRGNLTLYPNYKLGQELRRTSAYDAELRRLASEAALGAKEIAVRDFFDHGDYYGGIHAELGRNRRGLRVGLVVADDFKSNWAEKGWMTRDGRHVRGRGILRRGARRAGLRVRAPRKRG